MRRPRLTIRPILARRVASLLHTSPAQAGTVSGIRVDHRSGQSFITWDDLPGSGWLYHVYCSRAPFVDAGSFDAALDLAQGGDNSAVDARISLLLAQTLTHRIAQDHPPRAPTP